MRPLQPLGGVQGRERDHVLLLLALLQGGDEGHGLRHVEQGLLRALLGTLGGAGGAGRGRVL